MQTRRKIWVKCPNCGWTQVTRARKTVTCHRCDYVYTVNPKRRLSRFAGYADEDDSHRRRMWGSHLAWDYVVG